MVWPLIFRDGMPKKEITQIARSNEWIDAFPSMKSGK